jgi:hypothetical protein
MDGRRAKLREWKYSDITHIFVWSGRCSLHKRAVSVNVQTAGLCGGNANGDIWNWVHVTLRHQLGARLRQPRHMAFISLAREPVAFRGLKQDRGAGRGRFAILPEQATGVEIPFLPSIGAPWRKADMGCARVRKSEATCGRRTVCGVCSLDRLGAASLRKKPCRWYYHFLRCRRYRAGRLGISRAFRFQPLAAHNYTYGAEIYAHSYILSPPFESGRDAHRRRCGHDSARLQPALCHELGFW